MCSRVRTGASRSANVPGGRYRVRAFLAPSLAQVEPEVRFLADGADHDFPLVVEEQGGIIVRADVAPEPPLLGRAVNLVVAVRTRSVDADGVVRSSPVVGVSVELTGLGRWVLRDDEEDTDTSTTFPPFTTTTREAPSPAARTDSSGMVRYELRCERTGNPNLSLRVPVRSATPTTTDPSTATSSTSSTSQPSVTVQTFGLDLPACVDPTTLTTTTTAPSGTGSTTTTEP